MSPLLVLIENIVATMQANMPLLLGIIFLLFAIHIVNHLTGRRLCVLGIVPRTLYGLIMIPVSPFIHGHFNHVFFNAIPLFVLANFLLLYGQPLFFSVSLVVIVLGGLLLWLFGRRAVHIGASSVIMGYFGFLLVLAYYQHNILSVGIAVVAVYYFGGLLLSILPGEKGVSWEGHVFGLASGAAAYFIAPLFVPLFAELLA